MLIQLINRSLQQRAAVCALALVLALAGVWSLTRLNTDAFPDTTPVQVQVNTSAPALVPEEIERLITVQVELALGGLPGLEEIRSVSRPGLSQVVLTFSDATDIYFARQQIGERLGAVEVPAGAERPQLGPVSTGLGEVFQYLLRYKDRRNGEAALTELRTLHDWRVKPALRSVPGTAEINSWGGFEKQYQVRLDPEQLIKYDLSFDQVVQAVQANNLNVGGGFVAEAGGIYLVLGRGRTADTRQLGDIVVATKAGSAVYLRDVADVAIGHEIRRGMITAGGQGEAVLGLGFMLMGKNSYRVTADLKARLEEVQKTLPEEVEASIVYDRTELVDHVIATVRRNLCEGAVLVVALLFIFLGDLRAGLIVALAIPLSMLGGFCGMLAAGIAGTLLSLGAIDFGIIVDSSVVMVENIVRRLASAPGGDRLEVIRAAAAEVRQPALFGQLIIMIVYLPILTLEGVEGKMFRPMAWTVIFVLIGSMVISVTLMPVLASLLLPRQLAAHEPLLVRLAQRLYTPLLERVLAARWPVIGLAAAALGGGLLLALGLGAEFVPRLAEGAIVVGVVRPVGIGLEESRDLNSRMEQIILRRFPHEVDQVWNRTGGPEVATDPSGIEATDFFISLKPRSQWRAGLRTQTELVGLMEKELADIPGQTIWFTQPIEQRLNEMVSGVRADVALKIFGKDLPALVQKARAIEKVLTTVPGCVDLAVEQLMGQPTLEVEVRREQLARYGLSAESVLALVEAVGGKPLGVVVEKEYRFPLALRLAENYRVDTEALKRLTVAAPAGERLPLERVAEVRRTDAAAAINREGGKRRIVLMCNVRGRDMASFVAEAQRRLAREVELPAEQFQLVWGGQFENLERASARLTLVVPLALLLIVGLLFSTYGSLPDTACIFLSVPCAAAAGVMGLWLREMPFSISAGVGFITLSGVSVLSSMVFVSAYRDLRLAGQSVRDAVVAAAQSRLRTTLLTAVVAGIGFVPMAVGSGMGAEVQRPLATVVIAGVMGSTAMTLFLLPALYVTSEGRC